MVFLRQSKENRGGSMHSVCLQWKNKQEEAILTQADIHTMTSTLNTEWSLNRL